MKEMQKETPLPLDFYDKNGWCDSIVDFYGTNPQFPNKEILNAPMNLLTQSIGNLIDIYGNFPDIVTNLLNQIISPLFFDNDYEKNVYSPIKKAAVDESNPPLADMAESLLILRKLHDKDKNLLLTKFQNEISQIDKPTDAEKFEYFVDSVHKITKVHIHQLIGIIAESSGKLQKQS